MFSASPASCGESVGTKARRKSGRCPGAPADVVAKEKEKLAKYDADIEALQGKLAALG